MGTRLVYNRRCYQPSEAFLGPDVLEMAQRDCPPPSPIFASPFSHINSGIQHWLPDWGSTDVSLWVLLNPWRISLPIRRYKQSLWSATGFLPIMQHAFKDPLSPGRLPCGLTPYISFPSFSYLWWPWLSLRCNVLRYNHQHCVHCYQSCTWTGTQLKVSFMAQ